MIYTEYFVKGTQPTEQCPLHDDRVVPRCAGRGLRQGLGPAAACPSTRPACRCRRPPPSTRRRTAGAPAAARALREAEPSPRRSAASGRASSAAARTTTRRRRGRRKKDEPKKKSGGGDTILRARPCPFDDLAGHRAPPRSRRRARLPAARCRPASSSRGPTASGSGSLRSRWRSCSTARASPARRTASSRPTRAASAAPAAASRAACTPTCSSIEPGDTGSIKVDQVRDAIERTAYRPFEGRRRVVIVDDADAHGGAGAERAAEDARGAAGGVDVRAGDVAAGRAAADGAVALPAAALRAARARRRSRRC